MFILRTAHAPISGTDVEHTAPALSDFSCIYNIDSVLHFGQLMDFIAWSLLM